MDMLGCVMTQKGESLLRLGSGEYVFVTNFFTEHLVLRVESTVDSQSIIEDVGSIMKLLTGFQCFLCLIIVQSL